MNNIKGDIAEFGFDIQAIANGLIVCRPIHAGTVYDRIVDNGKKLYRVQIKSVANKPKNRNYRFRLRRGDRSKYKKEHVDIFACYLHGSNSWFLVPNTGKASFTVTAIEYKENWTIFEKI